MNVHFNSLSSHGPYNSNTESFRLEIQCKSLTLGMLSLSGLSLKTVLFSFQFILENIHKIHNMLFYLSLKL